MSLLNTSAVEMVKSLKKGELTSEELVKSYIKEIKKKENDIQAWEYFDEELALKTCMVYNYKYAVITPEDIVIPPKDDNIQNN